MEDDKTAPNDEELMRSYALGDTYAFDRLYSRYERRVFAFLVARLPPGKKQAAGDLFQLVWLKLHQSRLSFDPDKKFSTWIFTIALNSMRDHLRGKENHIELNDSLGSSELIESTDPETIALLREHFDRIQIHLEKLSPEQKNAVLLVEVQGFSNTEAAGILGTTETAFRKLLSRARKTLSDLLKREGF